MGMQLQSSKIPTDCRNRTSFDFLKDDTVEADDRTNDGMDLGEQQDTRSTELPVNK